MKKGMHILSIFVFLILLNTLQTVYSYQTTNSKLSISKQSLENSEAVLLDTWKFIPGDSTVLRYEHPTFELLHDYKSYMNSIGEIDSLWNGIGWFQAKIFVDSSLAETPLGFKMQQTGASEIYINGIILQKIGTIFPSASQEISHFHRYPQYLPLNVGEKNIISIRFSDHNSNYFWENGQWSGFTFQIVDLNKSISEFSNNDRSIITHYLIFMIIPVALSFIHLFLFLLDRKHKQNFYYSLFLWAFIIYIYSMYQSWITTEMAQYIALRLLGIIGLILTPFFSTMTITTMMGKKGKTLLLVAFATVGMIIYASIKIDDTFFTITYIYISLVFYVAGRALFSPSSKKGLWIIRSGFFFLSVVGIYQILQVYEIVPILFGIKALYIYGVIGFILSMSVFLAYEYISNEKELENRIKEVEILSRKNLQKELEAKEQDAQRKILEADNKRKTKELEDARKLQESMLPKTIPNTEDLEIAVRMITATEVGGDYYDADLSNSGILNIALGDATGHGNKAGVMVAITKSMFTSLGNSLLIPDFFRKSSKVIRGMKLGNLFMSLLMLRTNGKNIILSAAGMPPLLLYKKRKNQVKEIVIKSMPLGGPNNFPYETMELYLESGDILLLTTDGIIELFNEKKELFGQERLINKLKGNVDSSCEVIVEEVIKACQDWRGETPQSDDITIMALKAK